MAHLVDCGRVISIRHFSYHFSFNIFINHHLILHLSLLSSPLTELL